MESFPEFLRAPGDPRADGAGAGRGCGREGWWVATRGATPIPEGRGSRLAPPPLSTRLQSCHRAGPEWWPLTRAGPAGARSERRPRPAPRRTCPARQGRWPLPYYLIFRGKMKRAACPRAPLRPHLACAFAATREASCSQAD